MTSGVDTSNHSLVEDYKSLFKEIKQMVAKSQLKASMAVNQELLWLYWTIGRRIDERQRQEGWGAGVLEKLAQDLQNSFPGVKGFSRSNLFRMRRFYRSCEKVAPAVRQLDRLPFFHIPWSHNILLMERLKSSEEKLWYAERTLENGLSKRALEDWISSNFFHRRGKAVTNFDAHLPYPQSQLAQEILKDPYNFDFLSLKAGFQERELEQGLMDHIQQFLIELGAGFSFVGRQHPLDINGKDYYLDLLFYHLKLRCYCIVDLKSTEFFPEYAGKMNFYLSAVDDLIKHPTDNPSIGMILCKNKDKVTVDYAFRDINKPIGVSEYEVQIIESLPENLKGSLPTSEEFERELERVEHRS